VSRRRGAASDSNPDADAGTGTGTGTDVAPDTGTTIGAVRGTDTAAFAAATDGGSPGRGWSVAGARDRVASPVGALALAGLVAVWWLITSLGRTAFPTPAETLVAWVAVVAGPLPGALASSLAHLALGYALGVGLAVPLAVLLSQSRLLRWMVDPYVDATYATPTIAYVPLIIAWFGLYFGARVVVVAAFCFFEVLVVTYEGLRSVDPDYDDVGRAFGLSWGARQRRIFLPAALPHVFAGLRIGVGRAVRGMVVAELFLAVVGVGAILELAGSRFDAATQLAVVLTVTALGVALQWLVRVVERRVVPWHHHATDENEPGSGTGPGAGARGA
jgi:ABC-type nitrate/sulfonate/bicarbonate transport system permease component